MRETMHFLGLLSALLFSFISSGMETALYRTSRVRMRIRAERGEWRAAWVNRMLDRMDGMVTTILIDNNIAAYAGTYFLTRQLMEWHVPHTEIVTTAFITPLFFVLTESLPKQLAFSRADYWTLALIRVFTVFRVVFAPMVWALNRISAWLRSLLGASGETPLSQSQRTLLLEHLNAGVADKVLSAEQNRMAVRIMELEGISARDSMVPLQKLVLLSARASRARAIEVMRNRRRQFVLLIDEQARPTGQVVTMHSLIMNPDTPDSPVINAAERLERIRANVAIPDVLNLFRKCYAKHALVVDRHQTLGLITSQSVLDRIAGSRAR